MSKDPSKSSKSKTRSLLRAVGIEEGEGDESGLRRGIYLLPNLITTGALFAGFYAMVAAMNGHFMPAAVAIYAASILDAADGRVARLTRTQSAFGAEYDSLSDMVAFGVAPALVAFSWALSALGQIGWVVTFIYMACAALRLARFNTQGDSRTFTGLASPSAAVLIASLVWVLDEQRLAGETVSVLAAATLAVTITLVGILMVSNFTYFSPKLITFRGRVPFFALVAVVLVFAIILADPPRVLLTLSGLYALSGFVTYVWNLTRKSKTESE
jgi:CDP-diacylglycerol--serine O-phosphatidyltransferase